MYKEYNYKILYYIYNYQIFFEKILYIKVLLKIRKLFKLARDYLKEIY